jgi:hypothetical protein
MRAPLSAARRLFAALALLAAAVPASADALQVRHSVARGTPATPDTVLTASAPTAEGAAIAPWVGVYRLTIEGKAGVMLDTRVMVERFGDRLSGVLLVDQQASGLSDVRVDGDALSMAVNTAEGRGRLVLRRTGEGVTGTLTTGRKVWQVTGAQSI